MIEINSSQDVVLTIPGGNEEYLQVRFHNVTGAMLRLIHTLDAAPDLLAALDDIVRHIHMDIGMQRRAQDAIKKARGAK
jgi:hypothetical protein